jgi:hypothetical protein
MGPPLRGTPAFAGKLTVDPDVVAERLGDDLVLVHLKTNKIYELNSTATRIFELAKAGHDRAGIETQLLAEYAVDQPALAENLEAALARLVELGLLK